MTKHRLITFLKANLHEPLPPERRSCRACKGVLSALRSKSYCVACWKALPHSLRRSIALNRKAPANRVSAAHARLLYAKADALLSHV